MNAPAVRTSAPSIKTLLFGLLALATLTIVAAACGARIETAAGSELDTTTSTTSTSRTSSDVLSPTNIGEFTIRGPGTVAEGDEFFVEATVIAGGPARIAAVNGLCQQLGPWRIRAGGAGTCTVTAEQPPNDTHLAGSDQTLQIDVLSRVPSPAPTNPNLKTEPAGTFALSAPGSALAGDAFAVTPVDVVGGEVKVSLVGTGCRSVGANQFIGDEPGSCRFVGRQQPGNGYARGPDRAENVDIVEAPEPGDGFFELAGSRTVRLNTPFRISAVKIIGGDVTIDVESGPCEPTTAPRSGTTTDSSTAQWFKATAHDDCVIVGTQKGTTDYTAHPRRRRTVEVPKPVGSFQHQAPDEVAIGERFTVTAVNVIGGVVTFTSSAPCTAATTLGTSANSTTFVADAYGTCTFSALQRPADTHDPGAIPDFTVDVPRPQGHFNLDYDSPVLVGEEFWVTANDIIGGSVSYQNLEGPCELGPTTGILRPSDSRPFNFIAHEPGKCVLKFLQTDNTDHEPHIETISIHVETPIGSFTPILQARTPTLIDQKFIVGADDIVGGDVEIEIDTPNICGTEPPFDFFVRSPAQGSQDPAPPETLRQTMYGYRSGECRMTLIQQRSATHRSAQAKTLVQQIEKYPGSFTVGPVPALATTGDGFKVEVTFTGGAVTLTASGPCEVSGPQELGYDTLEWKVNVTGPGFCDLNMTQKATDTYSAAQPSGARIDTRDQGTFSLDWHWVDIYSNADFEITVNGLEGGEVTIALADGSCDKVSHRVYSGFGCVFRASQVDTDTHRASSNKTIRGPEVIR